MLAYKGGVNEWAWKIELTLSIFAMNIFEISYIIAKTMYLLNHGKCIAIIIDWLEPIGIRLIITRID